MQMPTISLFPACKVATPPLLVIIKPWLTASLWNDWSAAERPDEISMCNSGRRSDRAESWRLRGIWLSPRLPPEAFMKISSDYKDLLRTFNAAGVRYLIVGGYAVMIHTEPRYTKDLR